MAEDGNMARIAKILLFGVFMFGICVHGQDLASPEFVNFRGVVPVSENTTIFSTVFTVKAIVPGESETDPLYRIEYKMASSSFRIGQRNGKVELISTLDYENKVFITTQVTATCDFCSPVDRTITVSVLDSNDNTPKFVGTTWSRNVTENAPPGTTIISVMQVTDLDYQNPENLQVVCNETLARLSKTPNVCQKFQVNRFFHTRRFWNGSITLKESLDFEEISLYQLPLSAFDGRFFTNQSVEVKVINVQDAPPVFTYAPSIIKDEEVPPFTVLGHVVAVDGDKDRPRPIRYEINKTSSDLFTIDPVTGNIENVVKLDYEDLQATNGKVYLSIIARELINATTGQLGNDSLTMVEKTINVIINDVNDNPPTIVPNSYNISIPEDIPSGTPLPNINLYIRDRDSTNNARFRLRLTQFTSEFAVSPTEGSESATAILSVRDTSLINYEVGPTRYEFQVVAEDYQNAALSGVASVIVNILDVNDNYPVFDKQTYNGSVLENATSGLSILQVRATDLDSGELGTAGIRFGLIGDGTNLFTINPVSGIVSVAQCSTPGCCSCIDFEQKSKYDMTVTAKDNNGAGQEVTTTLIIWILDVNDNKPAFTSRNYTSYIEELQTVPRPHVVVQAQDPDRISQIISYIIISDPSNLWRINPQTGNITAIRPILYSDTPRKNPQEYQGFFILSVQATDGFYNDVTNVMIYVIDINNNRPIFEQRNYYAQIPETTLGNVEVLTVKANDLDSPTSDAGKIDYSVISGDAGKFKIDGKTGVIQTSNDATFDLEKQRRYVMQVLAKDRGDPVLNDTCTVTIDLLDENNKNPYFEKTMVTVDVYENVHIGYPVYTVTAKDPDNGTVLRYEFDEINSAALNKNGLFVNRSSYDYMKRFTIDAVSGLVKTNATLDRDETLVVFLALKVRDVSAPTLQTGTGTLRVNIKEYNDQRPEFLDVKNITIREEQPTGSFVMTLLARDEDDAISDYSLTHNPYLFFTIAPLTGVVTINNPIDYESVKFTNFTVMVWDNGRPRLNNSATIYVTILNINDNAPIFSLPFYQMSIPENTQANTFLLQVSATDKDDGDYGVVKYSIDPNQKFCTIDPDTGRISIAPSADLDRERISSFDVQVFAYDSPLDPSVRRTTPTTVYITLSDVNDNPPIFSQKDYRAEILETMPIGQSVLQVVATDRDVGLNAAVTYKKVPNSGDPNNYFSVAERSGRIKVAKSLLRHSGEYFFKVEARDEDGRGPYLDISNVTIIVKEALNSPPIWVIPDRDNYTVDVLEEQYLGMLVIEVHAIDYDRNDNGLVDYFFIVNGKIASNTPEFRINMLTGVIRAEIVYDRERVPSYLLLLAAQDRGNPKLMTTRYLVIRILDVNDNVPMFPIGSNGETRDYLFTVPENAPLDLIVGTVEATDKDLAEYAKIFYYIISGNERGMFKLNATTGQLTVAKALDREIQNSFRIDVQATNNISDYTVIRYRQRRALDPSIVTVVIQIGNTNDNPPLFTTSLYHECISTRASLGQSIMKVEATDQDSPESVVYRIKSGNTGNALAINPNSGIIYNQVLMSRTQTFEMVVTADDGQLTADTQVLIFVTDPDTEVKLVIAQPASEVRLIVQTLKNTFQGFKDDNGNPIFTYVCASSIVDHVLDDGATTKLWSDIYISAICQNCENQRYYIFPASRLLSDLNYLKGKYPDIFSLLYIQDMQLATSEEEHFDRTATLAVMIIVIALIVLALLLLLVACCCIRKQKKDKQKLLEHRVMSQQQSYEPSFVAADVSKNYNPMYDNQAFVAEEPREGIYAKVRKGPSSHRAPQPIPEPEILTGEQEIEVEIADDDDVPQTPRSSTHEGNRYDDDEADEEFRIETEVV